MGSATNQRYVNPSSQSGSLIITLQVIDSLESDPNEAIQSYVEGDLVKAMILDVDEERNRISFGLKPSYFNESPDSAMFSSSSTPSAQMQSHSVQDGEKASSVPKPSAQMQSVQDGEKASSVPDLPASLLINDEIENRVTFGGLEASMGFDWNNTPSSELAGDDGVISVGKAEGASGVLEMLGMRNKRSIESDLTQELQHRGPQSSSDFERLLLGSPNSSYIWIRYASFHIQLSDAFHAREVLRRALDTIHFREERERFNVWISLLNLECTFGDEEKLKMVFQEAIKANDPKTIHLRLASIQQQAGNHEVDFNRRSDEHTDESLESC